MAYITSDGRVLESRPFSLGSITDLFWGFINFFVLFFRTLINPQANKKVSFGFGENKIIVSLAQVGRPENEAGATAAEVTRKAGEEVS